MYKLLQTILSKLRQNLKWGGILLVKPYLYEKINIISIYVMFLVLEI